MRKMAWIFVAAAAAIVAGPGAAQQEQSAPEQPTITVEGHSPDDQIRALVDSLPPAPANGHIARFEHDACPAILGVPPAQRALIAARMRAVGAAAGVPMGRATCRPNIVILVTSDKRQLIEQLARRYPYFLGELSRRRIARLAESPEPSALWHLNGTVDAAGRVLTASGGNVPVMRTARQGSRIVDQTHPEYVGSVLVLQASALEGLTTTQLADYAAMRTLSGADPARLPGRDGSTILTLLDTPMGSEAPVTLTNWDLAFLQSLYASDVDIHAPGQRGEIQAGMRRTLEHPGDRPHPH